MTFAADPPFANPGAAALAWVYPSFQGRNRMTRFKRPAQLLAAGLVCFALTSAALAQQIKEIKFEGQNDQDAATRVALAWMNDKTKHGTIFVRAIKILNEGGKYVALMQYSDAN
jgi:hypothetical protein